MVVDGSLTDCEWAGGIMKNWTKEGWKCEILFVYAEEEVMLRRAERRAKITGRVSWRARCDAMGVGWSGRTEGS